MANFTNLLTCCSVIFERGGNLIAILVDVGMCGCEPIVGVHCPANKLTTALE